MDQWLLSQDGMWGYLGLLIALLAGALGLPIPEDFPLLVGGILINQGKTEAKLTFLVCYAGTLIGDIIIYAVGRSVGLAVTKKPWFRLRFGDDSLSKVKQSLEKRSILMIFIARHLFYLRTLTFLTCGALRMSFARFLAADAIAALISVPLMLSLGYIAAEHYDAVVHGISKAKELSLVLVAFLLLAGFVYYRRRRALQRRKSASEQANGECSGIN
ncbi:MAG: DedA family protein [Oligoflexia bacterium]|nr:DedA family protein [Oligoflexia bacterium]